jgi:hypothetical protein
LPRLLREAPNVLQDPEEIARRRLSAARPAIQCRKAQLTPAEAKLRSVQKKSRSGGGRQRASVEEKRAMGGWPQRDRVSSVRDLPLRRSTSASAARRASPTRVATMRSRSEFAGQISSFSVEGCYPHPGSPTSGINNIKNRSLYIIATTPHFLLFPSFFHQKWMKPSSKKLSKA